MASTLEELDRALLETPSPAPAPTPTFDLERLDRELLGGAPAPPTPARLVPKGPAFRPEAVPTPATLTAPPVPTVPSQAEVRALPPGAQAPALAPPKPAALTVPLVIQPPSTPADLAVATPPIAHEAPVPTAEVLRQRPVSPAPAPAPTGWLDRLTQAAKAGATVTAGTAGTAARVLGKGMAGALSGAGASAKSILDGLARITSLQGNAFENAGQVVVGLVSIVPSTILAGGFGATAQFLDETVPGWRDRTVAEGQDARSFREIGSGQITPEGREARGQPLKADEALETLPGYLINLGLFGHQGPAARTVRVPEAQPGALELHAPEVRGAPVTPAQLQNTVSAVQRAAGAEIPAPARPTIGFGDFLEFQGKRRGLTPGDPDFARLRREYDQLGAPRYGTIKDGSVWHVIDLQSDENVGAVYVNGAIAQMQANRLNQDALQQRIEALRPPAAPPAPAPPRVIGREALSPETKALLVPERPAAPPEPVPGPAERAPELQLERTPVEEPPTPTAEPVVARATQTQPSPEPAPVPESAQRAEPAQPGEAPPPPPEPAAQAPAAPQTPEVPSPPSKPAAPVAEGIPPAPSGVAEARPAYAPPFYSQAERAIEQKMPVRAPAAQVRGILNGAGVKPDELKWAGLDDWLAERASAGQPVTKQEALDFIRQNQVRVEEVVKSNPAEMRPQNRIELPGGQNYRELLLTLPGRPERTVTPSILGEAQRLAVTDGEDWAGLGPNGRQRYVTRALNASGAYRSPHFDEPNVLAHVRFNDRTDAEGRRVLFIEEVQSDWHQTGRREGYAGQATPWPAGARIVDDTRPGGAPTFVIQDSTGRSLSGGLPTREEAEALLRTGAVLPGGVPPAPFAKTWHELAFKRILRWAAENGYDRVGWTTGAQQAERYDLSKQIESIHWSPITGTTEQHVQVLVPDGLLIRFNVKDGTVVSAITNSNAGELVGKRLDQVLGKDVADKIQSEHRGRLAGEGLRIGGGGMAGFYDKILPEFANKYGKKWGARVGTAGIETDTAMAKLRDQATQPIDERPWAVLEGDSRTGVRLVQQFETRQGASNALDLRHGNQLIDLRQRTMAGFAAHVIDITPAMKRSVLEEGQALFEPRRAMGKLPAGQTAPQLELVYPERPDAGPQAKPMAAQALRDLDAARLRVSSAGGALARRGEEAGSGVRTLGVGISAELRQQGRVDLRGRLASTAEEVAQILQITRDPRYETVRFTYVDDAGRVVGQEAITSRLPGSAAAYLEPPPKEAMDRLLADETLGERELPRVYWDMRDRMRRLKATGYWISHNHPSGSVDPSRADRGLTEIISRAVPGFKGHVVIDHGEYAVIEVGAPTSYNRTGVTVRREVLPAVAAQPDPLLSARLAHGFLGEEINKPAEVAGFAAALKTPEGWVPLLYRGSDGRVRAIQEMPEALFLRPDEAADYIRGRQREFGAPETYAWTQRATVRTMRAAEALAERGALNDLVYNDIAPGVRSGGWPVTGSMALEARQPLGRAVRVEEERQPPVGEAGEPGPLDEERRRFEPPVMPPEILTAPQLRLGIHKAAVKAAERAFLDAGIQRDPERYPVLSDQILDMMREGRIEIPALERTLRAEGLDLAQFGEELFRPAVRDAARRLQALSVLERKLNTLAAEIDKASTPEERQQRAEELGRTIKLTREIDEGFRLRSLLQRLDNVRRGLLVSQLATAVRNFESQVGRVGLDVADTAIQRTLEKWFNKGVRGPSPVEVFGEIADTFRQIGSPSARERIRGEVDRFLAQWPRQYDRFYGHWSSDVASAARDQHVVLRGADAVMQKAEHAVEILNWANILQEYVVRRSVFQTEMAHQLGRAGLDPIEVFGGRRTLTEAERARFGPATKAAVEKALEMTFAQTPTYGSFGWHFVSIINTAPPIFTSVIPFPRFMVNSLRFLHEFSPTGLLKFISPTEREAMRNGNYQTISRAALGSAILLASYAIREGQPDDNRWYEITLPGQARPTDMRPFNPFATYLFVAEVAKRMRKGTLYTLDHKDLLSGLLSANIRSGTTNYLVDSVLRDVTQFADPERFKRAWATASGELAAGFLTPLQQVQDVLGQFSEHVRTIKDTRIEPFLGPLKAKIPGLSETLPFSARPTRAAPPMREMPLLRQTLGLTLSSEKNDLERELDRLQFQPSEIFHPSGEPLVDNRAKKLMGEAVESRLVPRIASDMYQAKSDAQRGEWLRERLADIRATVMQRAQHELVREARAEGPDQLAEIQDMLAKLKERRRPKRQQLTDAERANRRLEGAAAPEPAPVAGIGQEGE